MCLMIAAASPQARRGFCLGARQRDHWMAVRAHFEMDLSD
jgi:hypothetical protein